MRIRLSKNITIKLLQELGRDYAVRLHFTNNLFTLDGCARYWNNSISISLRQNSVSMLSTFFHEIGHIYCWDNQLWKSYHIDKPLFEMTQEEKKRYVRTALKAERWVDNWAKKEMKKHFPKLTYIAGYDEVSRKEFLNYIKKDLNV